MFNINSVIDQLIKDDRYVIHKEGYIETSVPPKGSGSVPLRKLSIYTTKLGYSQIKYQKTTILLHRIIYRKFKGELNSKLTINHIDGNKSNNNVDNLEQISHSKNMKHAYRILKIKPNKTKAKITYEIAQLIREIRKNFGTSYAVLGKRYGLTKTSVSSIIKFKTWKNP